MELRNDASLAEAKAWLRERVEDGEICPCCKQRAQVYERTINAGMAISLITMYKAAGKDFQHVPTTVGGKSREEGKLRYWGLVEEERRVRPDGGRAGFWRVTDAGEAFLFRRLAVVKWARVYAKQVLKLHGPRWTIDDALGTKFDYAELMGDVKPPTEAQIALAVG